MQSHISFPRTRQDVIHKRVGVFECGIRVDSQGTYLSLLSKCGLLSDQIFLPERVILERSFKLEDFNLKSIKSGRRFLHF